ncbi:pyridoxal phosphate-dependent aminotransferase [Erysipelothrix piscisicarius]|uniref:pyridoxal phosphate-dependent aminotransferase n=1 Tax=Erysipelothrix piscisicarius TaxID=2485784 RepID=UPI002F923132
MKHRIEALTLSGIRQFSARFQGREDMIFLTIGEPDLDTPEIIKQAAVDALTRNETHYPPAIGNLDLRDAIARYESQFNIHPYKADNVIITNGATEGLTLAIWSVVTEGDEVVIFTPSFPLYQTQVTLAGAKPVLLDTSESQFQVTSAMLEKVISPRTRAILFATPNNPTGVVYNEASIQAIREVLSKRSDIYVIVDEVYRSMLYEGNIPSLRMDESIQDQIIITQSFSKSHAMTGWRVGYVLGEAHLIELMHRLHQNLVTGISSFSQPACIAALDVDTQYMVDAYAKRRTYVLARLDAMGTPVCKTRRCILCQFLVTMTQSAQSVQS